MKYFNVLTVLLSLAAVLFLVSCGNDPVKPPDNQAQEWLLLGLESESITAIAVDPIDEYVIYAGSGSDFSAGKVGGLFKSTNGGAAWDTLIRGITVRDIDIHPFDHQTFYVTCGINYLTPWGILKTEDGGMSWARSDTGLHLWPEEGPGVLAINPMYPDTLYLGTGGVFGGNLYRSTDAGQTWRAIGDTILWNGVTALAIDPQNTNVVYAGTAWIGAISKSTDGGKSWERLDFPEVGIVHDLLVHPSYAQIVYAGTWYYGFYHTTNGGTSWLKANLGFADTISVRKIALLSVKQIYIAANDMHKGAAYESNQDDIKWEIIGTYMFKEGINTLEVSKQGAIFAGAYGIYVLSESINYENDP